jgi:hypothetical protein
VLLLEAHHITDAVVDGHAIPPGDLAGKVDRLPDLFGGVPSAPGLVEEVLETGDAVGRGGSPEIDENPCLLFRGGSPPLFGSVRKTKSPAGGLHSSDDDMRGLWLTGAFKR